MDQVSIFATVTLATECIMRAFAYKRNIEDLSPSCAGNVVCDMVANDFAYGSDRLTAALQKLNGSRQMKDYVFTHPLYWDWRERKCRNAGVSKEANAAKHLLAVEALERFCEKL